jgi:hypothetical protein
VGPAIRQAVARPRVGGIPTGNGWDAGDGRVRNGQLIHELAGPLHEGTGARAVGHGWPIGAREQDPVVLPPPQEVERLVRVAQRRRAAAGLTTHRSRQALGQDDVRVQKEKRRRSARKSGDGYPFAITTLLAVTVPPAVTICTRFRLARTRDPLRRRRTRFLRGCGCETERARHGSI